MRCKLCLTANAGVVLTVNDRQILIDALHSEKVAGFSAVPSFVLSAVRELFSRRAPDMILATHMHPDHVSMALWNDAFARWPESVFLSPCDGLDSTVVLTQPRQRFTAAGIEIDAMRLPHEGVEYASMTHYGYFLRVEDFSVLIPGDCAALNDGICVLTAGRHVDLALLNFPWITLSASRAFVREVVAPSHLAVFHLPFAEDDAGGYRSAAFHAVKLLDGMDVRVLSEPLQEVVIL